MSGLTQLYQFAPLNPQTKIVNLNVPIEGLVEYVLSNDLSVHCKTSPQSTGQANNLAVASLASVTIVAATPTAKVWLHSLIISASVAGQYEIQDNGVTIYRVQLQANTPFVVPITKEGDFSVTANTALTFKNSTAGASDLTHSARYTLVL